MSKIVGRVANSLDPDQTPRSAASDLVVHCLLGPFRQNICSVLSVRMFARSFPSECLLGPFRQNVCSVLSVRICSKSKVTLPNRTPLRHFEPPIKSSLTRPWILISFSVCLSWPRLLFYCFRDNHFKIPTLSIFIN